jgi:hypothetical protein
LFEGGKIKIKSAKKKRKNKQTNKQKKKNTQTTNPLSFVALKIKKIIPLPS